MRSASAFGDDLTDALSRRVALGWGIDGAGNGRFADFALFDCGIASCHCDDEMAEAIRAAIRAELQRRVAANDAKLGELRGELKARGWHVTGDGLDRMFPVTGGAAYRPRGALPETLPKGGSSASRLRGEDA